MRLLSIAFLTISFLATSVFADGHNKTLTVADGWVRLTPPVVENTAGYFKLTNDTKETLTLIGAETSVAKMAEFHDMVNDNGAMSMQHIPELTLKPGESIMFRPGGKHLMFMGLKKPLKEAQMVDVTFVYKSGKKQSLTLPVKRQEMKMQHKH